VLSLVSRAMCPKDIGVVVLAQFVSTYGLLAKNAFANTYQSTVALPKSELPLS
jgi:hypothetical protein